MRKAICIGVSLQAHPDPSLKSLPQCESDVSVLSSFLESDLAGFEVERILNPTSTSVKDQLWNILENVGPDDQVLIYFSGHGRRNNARKLQLCLHDTKADRLVVSSISFDQMLEICNEAGAESLLIMLDCCFSGAAEKSIIAKGSDEIFLPHEKAILSSKGLSVLSSCSSVELSYADDKTNLSSFTASLLDLCKKKSGETSGWLTVGQLYEDLRFSVRAHSPKLIGNNPTFPVCKGYATHQPVLTPSQPIELRQIIEDYVLLYGILVMPYYRAWLIGAPKGFIPPDTAQVGKGVHVIYNDQELYPKKINDAKKYIQHTLRELEYLSQFLSTTILLLYPVAIEENTYKRFQGSDRKYILTTAHKLSQRKYPVITQQNYGYTISGSKPDFSIHRIPEDYLREAFGLIVDSVDKTALMFREDSFSKNAKYLKVESYTNRVFESLTFGSSLGKSKVSFNSTPKEKKQFETLVDRSRIREKDFPMEVIGRPFIVPPKKQVGKTHLLNESPCQVCLGERFREVSVNNRLYRIPCRACNSGHDNSWRAFPDL
jgi:hypothetical protein